jgi:glycosyltransferase involved in cell wall biosynthesis
VQPPSDRYSSQARQDREPFTFGFIGGPGYVKGWDLICETFAELDLPEVRIVVVDGGSNVGQSWRAGYETSGSGVHVEIVPGYSVSEIDDVFTRFDALLSPSMCKETFGLGVREAMIRDIWVIVSDAGGLAEDVVDGENGRVLPWPPTRDDLMAAVKEAVTLRPRDLPYKDRVSTLDQQARHLASILESAVSQDESDLEGSEVVQWR